MRLLCLDFGESGHESPLSCGEKLLVCEWCAEHHKKSITGGVAIM
jgi:hypothetical protein